MTPSAEPTAAARASRAVHALPRLLALGGLGALLVGAASIHAAPSKSSRSKTRLAQRNARLAAAPRLAPARKPMSARAIKPMPRYLPIEEIDLLRSAHSNLQWTGLTPTVDGRLLPPSRPSLPGAGPMMALPPGLSAPALPPLARGPRGQVAKPQFRSSAQRFPRVIAPARVRPARPPVPVVPRWVRYPLEFQLCGIGIGTRAVDKDAFNRIDRYGLFALHGNPTSVVVPGLLATTNTGGPGDVAASGGGGEGGGGGGRASSGGGRGSASSSESGGASTSGAATVANIEIPQQPPGVSALFPDSPNGGIPDWAAAITVGLDNNHVEWLYNRDTYSMGFVVDRLGFCDAIVVAGTASPIANTQLEDPAHTVRLGDDLRKVLNRYGYPDTIESYTTTIASVGVNTPAAGGGGGEGGAPSPGSAPGAAGGRGSSSSGSSSAGSSSGAEGGGAGATAGNEAFRTFELRYEQSYNVVFTIRNNRVVRIYIFGDPDFFNDRRRRQFRISY